MSVKRVYTKVKQSPETVARLQAIREKYQREKPTLEQVMAENPDALLTTLGELLQIKALTAQLKTERERQHLTLAEISNRTGIDQATLSRLENGKADNPTVSTIVRIASSMGKVVNCTLVDAPV